MPTAKFNIDFTEEDVPAAAAQPSTVLLHGLPFSSTESDVRDFADGYSIDDPDGVLVITHGERRGEAFLRFKSAEEAQRFQAERNRHNIKERYVEIFPSSGEEMERARKDEENSGSLTKNPIVRLRGLPFLASEDDVRVFFSQIADSVINIRIVEDAEGRSTGDAFLELADEDAVKVALTKHRLLMGTRYIEVTRSSAADREALLHVAVRRNRMGQRGGAGSAHLAGGAGAFGGGANAAAAAAAAMMMNPMMAAMAYNPMMAMGAPPLKPPFQGVGPNGQVSVQIGKAAAKAAQATQAAQAAAAFMMRAAMFGMMPPPFPMVPMVPPLMPGAGITPPTPLVPPTPRPQSRFVVRIRGLPFSASEATVAEFFHDVNIPPQGVHMVYNPQERPTGEAFVEVETEEDIQTALQHNGGALGHRYIEVFKSSIGDMMRLAGGGPVPLDGAMGMGMGGVDGMMPMFGMPYGGAPFY